MDELLKTVAENFGYATPFFYGAFAYKIFSWLDSEASDSAKAAIAGTMKLKDYDSKQIASALVEMFDRLYTSPLLHWRAMLRSALFTTAISAVFAFEMRNSQFIQSIRSSTTIPSFAIGFATNLISDYVSLFIIRPCLGRWGGKPIWALAFGTFLSILVVCSGMILRNLLFNALLPACDINTTTPAPLVYGTSTDLTDLFRTVSCALFYVAFITLLSLPAMAVFVWLPLFALGILVARALTPLSRAVTKFQWALREGDKHPLRAIGCIAGLAVFIVTAAWQTMRA